MNAEIQRIVSLVNDNSVDDLVSLFDHQDANSTQIGGEHYKSEYQHWDLMADLQPSWPEGCMSKYLCRVFKKNGLQDVEKVLHYCYKLMSQVHLGNAGTPNGKTTAQRADLYVRFYKAQDFQAPTQDLQLKVRDCFRHLSIWQDLRDLKVVFQVVCELHDLMSKHLDIQPAQQNDPIQGPEVEGSTPTPEYVEQDERQSALAHVRHLASTTPSILPIRIYSSALEMSRRDSMEPLSLSVNDQDPAFCRDYSEPGLKIELAMSHLRESLPNQQELRTSLALSCLLDGTASLLSWHLLRPSTKVNPVPHLVQNASSSGITSEDLLSYMQDKK